MERRLSFPLGRFGIVLGLLVLFDSVQAGPLTAIAAGSAIAACYTACNSGWVACMSGYGLVAGTTGPVGLAAVAAGCSVIQGTCMAACTTGGLAATVAPTP